MSSASQRPESAAVPAGGTATSISRETSPAAPNSSIISPTNASP